MFLYNICNLVRFWNCNREIHPVNSKKRKVWVPAASWPEGEGSLHTLEPVLLVQSAFSGHQEFPCLDPGPAPACRRGGGRGNLVDQSSLAQVA